MDSRHIRKLKRFSESFNSMFDFFLGVYRKSIITFYGRDIIVKGNPSANSAKVCFRMFEDGHYSKSDFIETRHPNILYAVLAGKKGWGLWRDQWTDGIAEGSFTKDEILGTFSERGVDIPNPFIKEFEDFIYNKVKRKTQKLIEEQNEQKK